MLFTAFVLLLALQDPPKPYSPDWKPTAAELIKMLDEEKSEPKIRYLLKKARGLGESGVGVFVHGTDSSNAFLATESWAALGEMGVEAKSALPRFVERICSDKTRQPLLDGGLISSMRHDPPELKAILGKPVEQDRHAQIAAIARIARADPAGFEKSLAACASATVVDGWSTAHTAWNSLAIADPKAATTVFKARWKEAKDAERILLLGGMSLAKDGDPEVSKAAIAMLESSSPDLRLAAVAGLMGRGRNHFDLEEVAPKLVKILSDKSGVTRFCASTLLLTAKDGSGRKELTRLVNDPVDDVAFEAAWFVGSMGRAKLTQPELYMPPDPELAGALLAVAKSTRSLEVRDAAIGALGGLGLDAKACVPGLQDLAKSPEQRIRLASEIALGEIADAK